MFARFLPAAWNATTVMTAVEVMTVMPMGSSVSMCMSMSMCMPPRVREDGGLAD